MVDNIFDGLQEGLFNTSTTVFGYDASWSPLVGGGPLTASVLLNEPTDREIMFKQEYNPEDAWIEYKEGDFPGLYESVRSGGKEIVVLNSINYQCRYGVKKYDGKTIRINVTRS